MMQRTREPREQAFTFLLPRGWALEGDVIYTDENSFDPNTIEEYKTREWKRTPIRKR
jgi:hypothetical protein